MKGLAIHFPMTVLAAATALADPGPGPGTGDFPFLPVSEAEGSPGSSGQTPPESAPPPPAEPAAPAKAGPASASPPDADTVAGKLPKPKTKRPPAHQAAHAAAARGPREETQVLLRAHPGATLSARIARGLLNRISTPFDDPKVLTVSPVETHIEGRSVYVATESYEPVGLFITDAGGEAAVSLELIPEDRSRPAEIRIESDAARNAGGEPATAAGRDDPYLDDLKATMKTLAQGLVPAGYSLSEPREAVGRFHCAMPGAEFEPGQILSGSRYDIVVFRATNRSGGSLSLDETACAAPGVRAVAAWPRLRLRAGESAEVYVIVDAGAADAGQDQRRPSLLEAGNR
ncbi:TraK domain-containing protein [Methylococcus capsulatus]|uniref:TraK domain-containing protein n=1 Tax=Methylococcus capsulatus TaxID=414 RepID=UPI001C5299AA|nr:type-F conjugative transfer system secretin TraK [Methylococcus capsulatus]QXP89489.1 type-F conjugative transfer system secretin TraK [Methylococcus capsulatus]